MTGSRQLPTTEAPTVRQGVRVGRLERRLLPTAGSGSGVSAVLFSFAGPLADGVESGRWYADDTREFTKVRVSAASAPTDQVVKVRLNGVDYATLTLPAGDDLMEQALSLGVTADDYLTAKTVTTDGDNLDIQLSP